MSVISDIASNKDILKKDDWKDDHDRKHDHHAKKDDGENDWKDDHDRKHDHHAKKDDGENDWKDDHDRKHDHHAKKDDGKSDHDGSKDTFDLKFAFVHLDLEGNDGIPDTKLKMSFEVLDKEVFKDDHHAKKDDGENDWKDDHDRKHDHHAKKDDSKSDHDGSKDTSDLKFAFVHLDLEGNDGIPDTKLKMSFEVLDKEVFKDDHHAKKDDGENDWKDDHDRKHDHHAKKDDGKSDHDGSKDTFDLKFAFVHLDLEGNDGIPDTKLKMSFEVLDKEVFKDDHDAHVGKGKFYDLFKHDDLGMATIDKADFDSVTADCADTLVA